MNTEHFREKLEEELQTVEGQLRELGHLDLDPTATEKDELADRMEDQEEKSEEAITLMARRADIADALDKIKNGTYGACEVSGEPIEEARLEANPAARTCEKHIQ